MKWQNSKKKKSVNDIVRFYYFISISLLKYNSRKKKFVKIYKKAIELFSYVCRVLKITSTMNNRILPFFVFISIYIVIADGSCKKFELNTVTCSKMFLSEINSEIRNIFGTVIYCLEIFFKKCSKMFF